MRVEVYMMLPKRRLAQLQAERDAQITYMEARPNHEEQKLEIRGYKTITDTDINIKNKNDES